MPKEHSKVKVTLNKNANNVGYKIFKLLSLNLSYSNNDATFKLNNTVQLNHTRLISYSS